MTEHNISKNVKVVDMRKKSKGRPSRFLKSISTALKETIYFLENTNMICTIIILSDTNYSCSLKSEEKGEFLKLVNY